MPRSRSTRRFIIMARMAAATGLGRHYSEGNLVNAYASPNFSSINITPDNIPRLLPWNYVDPYPYWNTFSGNLIIVSGGQAV